MQQAETPVQMFSFMLNITKILEVYLMFSAQMHLFIYKSICLSEQLRMVGSVYRIIPFSSKCWLLQLHLSAMLSNIH